MSIGFRFGYFDSYNNIVQAMYTLLGYGVFAATTMSHTEMPMIPKVCLSLTKLKTAR